MDKDYLLLKRAALSRPSGEWSDDDYDVLTGSEIVGRIFKANAGPGLSWMTHDPKTIEAMTAKVLVAAPDPVMAPVNLRQEPPQRVGGPPMKVPWNDSETRDEPIEKAKLRLTPHEPNAND